MPSNRSTGGGSDESSKTENNTSGDDVAELEQSLSCHRGATTKLLKRIDELLQMAQDDTDNIITVQELRGCYEMLVDNIALLARMDQQLIGIQSDDERRSEENFCLSLMEKRTDKIAEVNYSVVPNRPVSLVQVLASNYLNWIWHTSMVSTLNGHPSGTNSKHHLTQILPYRVQKTKLSQNFPQR